MVIFFFFFLCSDTVNYNTVQKSWATPHFFKFCFQRTRLSCNLVLNYSFPGFLKVFPSVASDIGFFFTHFQPSSCIRLFSEFFRFHSCWIFFCCFFKPLNADMKHSNITQRMNQCFLFITETNKFLSIVKSNMWNLGFIFKSLTHSCFFPFKKYY